MITVPEGWDQVRELGKGAMGEVVEVRHERFGHRAALKCMTSEPERFIAETRTVAGLNHPNIVRVFDIGPTWMVMELAHGTLQPARTFDDVRTAIADLLDALAIAHAWDVLHLDVKPTNILVRPDGTHVLADFGVAVEVGTEATTTGGSLGFMAPERFEGGPLSAATDLYSVGCTAWWMVTGNTPHTPTDWQHAWESSRSPLPELKPRIAIPPGFHDWVQRCLHPIPEKRFQSAAEARRALLGLGPALVSAGNPRPRTSPAATLPTLPQGRAQRTVHATAVTLPVPERWPAVERSAPLEGIGHGAVDRLVVPFVGRTSERERLWERLRCGHGVTVLRGPAGSGKTRLGEEFSRAARAWAGARVQRSAQALSNRAGRVVVWLDDVVPDADRIRALSSRASVVIAVQSTRWQHVKSRLENAEVLDVAPLEPDTVRTLLADWVGLAPRDVAAISNHCGSDLTRALAMVRDTTLREIATPTPTPDTLLAAAWGDHIDVTRDARMKSGAQALLEAGSVVETDRGVHWVSRVVRQQVLNQASTVERDADHRDAAALRTDQERWERGQSWLAAGETAQASEDLFEGSALAIARGQMVTALSVFDALEAAAEPGDTLTQARIARARAIVGPTFQSHEAVAKYNDIALDLSRPHAEEPHWRRVFRSALSGRQWLAEARMLPRPGKPWLDELAEVAGPTAMTRIHQAMYQMQTGDNEAASATLDECLALAKAENHTQHIGVVTYLRWLPRVALGDRAALQPMAQDFHVMVDDYGLESARADANVAMGNAYRWFGELDAAADRYARANRAIAAGRARADLGCRVYQALLARDLGDIKSARDALEVCWGLLRDEGAGWEGFIAIHLASVCEGTARAHWKNIALPALSHSGLRLPDIDTSLRRLG